MSWDGHKLEFSSSEELIQYMRARLRGDLPGQPPISSERGVSPEDILIQYYRYGELDTPAISSFWLAWRTVATEAWERQNLPAYRNAISLACAVDVPENAQEITSFLPKQSDGYDWMDHASHGTQGQTLRLFREWSLVPEEDEFWRDAFSGYLRYIESNDEKLSDVESLPPLIAAYNGMGRLKDDDYMAIIYAVIANSTLQTRRLLRLICEDQSSRFKLEIEELSSRNEIFQLAWSNTLLRTIFANSSDQDDEKHCLEQTREYLQQLASQLITSVEVGQRDDEEFVPPVHFPSRSENPRDLANAA